MMIKTGKFKFHCSYRKLFIGLLLMLPVSLFSQRLELELSGKDPMWKAWMDESALWEEDTLLLPGEFRLEELKINVPTCGWEDLYSTKGKKCQVPTSVEEQFGTSNKWTYHGVSWFWRNFHLPSDWKGKEIFLDIAKYNHRVEIFINEQLVGYDVVGLLPYRCNVTKALKYGAENRLAIRVTSPGGCRGWDDFQPLRWGKQWVIPNKDYSGIGGKVSLTGVIPTYIEDVFVKNLLPAGGNNIDVQTTVINGQDKDINAAYRIEIIERRSGRTCYNNRFNCVLQPGENILHRNITVKDAAQWSADHPELYTCNILMENELGNDSYSQLFGFRVFEIREVDGRHNFYLNGQRLRIRSAIEWGIYAFNGLFPTDEVARRSIMSVKAVGHNSLNFHRRVGDTPVFNNADSIGVYMYEEPGSFNSGRKGYNIDTVPFMRKQMYERLRRMVIRDRNHPSLLIYSLANENETWTLAREMGMRIVHGLDNSRLIINTSGETGLPPKMTGIHHIPPYCSEIQKNYLDHHTPSSPIQLSEEDLKPKTEDRQYSDADSCILYWGEVRCFAGTFNYPLMAEQGKATGGYDYSMYLSQTRKLKDLYDRCSFGHPKHPAIRSVFDITRQAGKGQYYSDGRLGQVMMTNDHTDGYAINGWSPGPDMPLVWSSGILDQNRNPNADPAEMAFWNRPLQVAVIRQNGKYFRVNDTIKMKVSLINENKIPAGEYILYMKIKDGTGKVRQKSDPLSIQVKGGDVFAQTLIENYTFVPRKEWASGYLTVEGELYRKNRRITEGKEQVLLQNRISQGEILKGRNITVVDWKEAGLALKEAGVACRKETAGKGNGLILAGKGITPEQFETLLERVKNGANMILQMDNATGELIYEKGLISEKIEAWGGVQTGHWLGNGSSYIETFAGDQPVPSGNVISTRSWEAQGAPKGFYPFKSRYPLRIYGLYVAHQFETQRRKQFTDKTNVLVTYGEIGYGKGKILLNSSYWIDENSAFSDLLFYNMVDFYSSNR